MAWTTSACLRARPPVGAIATAWLKPAKYLYAAGRRSAQRAQPGVFLALTALSLGALTPFLPTSFTAAVLLLTGIALAVLGAGANLAVAVSSTRPHAGKAPASRYVPRGFPEFPPQQAAPTQTRLARIRRPQPVHIPNHDWAGLMARINHELRTPLNAVIGFSEVMALE